MHGLISLLPQPYFGEVESIWKELEDKCGLTGIRVTPFPHFSWAIAEDYDWPVLEHTLAAIAAATQPIRVHTTGLGLFTGSRPVIYVPVVKTASLADYHQMLWEAILPASRGASRYYSPELWMPHISLAYQDVDKDNAGHVIERLAFRSYDWEIEIDNLSLVFEPAGVAGTLRYNYPFAG